MSESMFDGLLEYVTEEEIGHPQMRPFPSSIPCFTTLFPGEDDSMAEGTLVAA